MSYKNNYELWNPALATRRPSQMSEIDIILAQTYPHVAMLPYSSCCHCSYEEEEEEDEIMSPSINSTFMSDESIRSTSTQHSNGNGCAGSNKRTKIRSRLRKIFKTSSRSS